MIWFFSYHFGGKKLWPPVTQAWIKPLFEILEGIWSREMRGWPGNWHHEKGIWCHPKSIYSRKSRARGDEISEWNEDWNCVSSTSVFLSRIASPTFLNRKSSNFFPRVRTYLFNTGVQVPAWRKLQAALFFSCGSYISKPKLSELYSFFYSIFMFCVYVQPFK